MDGVGPAERGRGVELLLAHCAALAWPAECRPPATERLRDLVGEELARLLLAGLTRTPSGRGVVPRALP